MVFMTVQPPLPVVMDTLAVPVGLAVSLVEDATGGEVYIRGQLSDVWDAQDVAARRWAAVKLVRLKVATQAQIAAAFGVSAVALWNWCQLEAASGVAALVSEKMGPKRPSRLVPETIDRIVALRAQNRSLRAIGAAVGVSEFSVRRALKIADERGDQEAAVFSATVAASSLGADAGIKESHQEPLPLPASVAPPVRSGERAAAAFGLLDAASPVFTPTSHVRHAGLFLAFPALERSGLLECAKTVYGSLPPGLYGLDTVLIDAVLRALAGESRAEGATRFDPVELGRVLGMDRAPEVKTIRRKISQLAGAGQAQELIKALATHHLAGTGPGGEDLAAILYVDGHVRAYQGTKKIGKLYSTRLKFPVPATEETWVTDSLGSPVFLVMAEPGASLAAELRRLLPELRAVIGDDRRSLVGFDRGGWSPALFKHMDAAGFDVLTWRKGAAKNIQENKFTTVSYTDEYGQDRSWSVADTLVDLRACQYNCVSSSFFMVVF